MKSLRRLSIVILIALVGGFIANLVFTSWNNRWVSQGSPPQPVMSIASTHPVLIVRSKSGSLFKHCGKECWEPIREEMLPDNSIGVFPCGEVQYPRLDSYREIALECETIGVQYWQRAYAISDSGDVLIWEKYAGEWSGWDAIFVGVLTFLVLSILGLFIVLFLSFQDWLAVLQERATSSVSNEDE
jgi:hypothetical protein